MQTCYIRCLSNDDPTGAVTRKFTSSWRTTTIPCGKETCRWNVVIGLNFIIWRLKVLDVLIRNEIVHVVFWVWIWSLNDLSSDSLAFARHPYIVSEVLELVPKTRWLSIYSCAAP